MRWARPSWYAAPFAVAPPDVRRVSGRPTLFEQALAAMMADGPPAQCFRRVRICSISSMVLFISAMAASKGAEVVMSTPASFSRSMA